jgi:hypothetical protein
MPTLYLITCRTGPFDTLFLPDWRGELARGDGERVFTMGRLSQ